MGSRGAAAEVGAVGPRSIDSDAGAAFSELHEVGVRGADLACPVIKQSLTRRALELAGTIYAGIASWAAADVCDVRPAGPTCYAVTRITAKYIIIVCGVNWTRHT